MQPKLAEGPSCIASSILSRAWPSLQRHHAARGAQDVVMIVAWPLRKAWPVDCTKGSHKRGIAPVQRMTRREVHHGESQAWHSAQDDRVEVYKEEYCFLYARIGVLCWASGQVVSGQGSGSMLTGALELDLLSSKVLIYGLDTLTLTEKQINRIDAYYNQFLRRIVNIKASFCSRVSNHVVWETAGYPTKPSYFLLNAQYNIVSAVFHTDSSFIQPPITPRRVQLSG